MQITFVPDELAPSGHQFAPVSVEMPMAPARGDLVAWEFGTYVVGQPPRYQLKTDTTFRTEYLVPEAVVTLRPI